MNKEEITKEYNKLLEDVKTNDFYKIDLTNRVNCYTCQKCGHITKTKDIDAGVTPFMISCEKCKEVAYSSFYNDIAPTQEATIEWYRPSLEETINSEEVTLDHILQGGLDHRKIKKI